MRRGRGDELAGCTARARQCGRVRRSETEGLSDHLIGHIARGQRFEFASRVTSTFDVTNDIGEVENERKNGEE